MIANHGLMERWSQAIVRKAASLQFPLDASYLRSMIFGPSRTTYNYAADVQEGVTCSVVMPPIQFIMRAFPEAPLVMRRQQGDELEVEPGHPLVELVNRPNAFYPGVTLWMATIYDWCWAGEAYWRILTSRGGRPGELWWVPPWSIKPKWPDDGSVFISHYDYQPSFGEPIRLEPEEVIHFRHGIDPWNMRHGLPPLRAILQDIWTDAESANFIGAMLRNMGVPGIILSPKGETYLSKEDVDRIKAYIQSRFTGDQRGQPLALGTPTSVEKLSLSPTELDMSALRNTAEERVCAALGIPAAVVGFGTGLANSKVGATMHEFVGLAWNNGIVPMQRLMAVELQRALLPRFETDLTRWVLGWDYDEVKALEPDQNDLAKRAVELFQGGVLMRSQAQQLMGYEATEGSDFYLIPSSMTQVGPDAPEPPPLPVPPPASQVALGSNGQGNGNGSANGTGNGVGARTAARGLVAPMGRIGFMPDAMSHGHVEMIMGRADILDDDEVLTKQGTLEELVNSLISQHVERLEVIPPHLLRLVAQQWRRERALQRRFQREIISVLQRYGERVALAAHEVITTKQTVQDVFNASVILERLPLASVRAELEETYRRMYEQMFGLTQEMLDVAIPLPRTRQSAVATHLTEYARERVSLLDLPGEARTGILRSLEDARTQGLSEDQMMDLIRERVPAGRWRSIETRARTIARTESRYGANLATVAHAQSIGAARVLVLDARLGPTDEACTARNGWIVTPAEAQQLVGIEHPNGTISLLPLVEGILSPQEAAPSQVTLDDVMKAGRRLDTQWQKVLGPDHAVLVARHAELASLNRDLAVQADRAQSTRERQDINLQWRRTYAELQNVSKQIQLKQGQALHQVLSEVRPLGDVTAQWTPGTNAAVQNAISDVSKSLPRDWLQRSRNAGVMDGQLAGDGRGYYWSVKKEIRLSGQLGSPERVSNAFHEFGHRFEEVVPNIFELEDAFYQKRTQGGLQEDLRRLKNRLEKLGPGYRDNEMTRPDRFVNPYMGKPYPNQRNYELLSMGLESVFTGSFDLTKDPEFRRFILGILATV